MQRELALQLTGELVNGDNLFAGTTECPLHHFWDLEGKPAD